MKNLMNTLEVLGFTKENGLNGLSLNNISVSMHWSGEEAVVAIDGKQVFKSESEDEIIDFVKSQMPKEESSQDAECGSETIIEVTRVEFNSREAQDEYQNQMRFAHIPKTHMSYQEVFAMASKIQNKFKASFRIIACEAVYNGAFFVKYQNNSTTFFKY